jgi:hypothetical protein
MKREYIVTEASVSDALEISRILRAAFDHNLAFIINTHTAEETNGEGNEEKEPDIRYQWEKAV